ncbi:MAG TPA: hypothetical protein VK011_08685 [Acidimicrobiia bacterium]|nr:hypothetical protein [Acidimicrobiia bacterium]
MTTHPTAAPAPTTPGNGKLRARLWIGHNPVLFVFGCAAAGLLLGRRTVRRSA